MTKKRLLLCTFTLVIVSLLLFALSGCVLFNKMCKHKNVIDDVGVAPTCTEEGLTNGKHCEKCGTVLLSQEKLAPLGHSYSASVIASTCIAEGYTLHTCSVCGDSYTDTKTPIIDHVYVPTQYEPLCNREGYTEYVCSACQDSYRESFIPVTAHRFNDGACIYCSSEQPPEEIVSDVDWYSDTKMVYTITTAEQLAGFATLVNEGASFDTKVVYLGADIDLQYLEWTPIGNAEHAFNGTFDGRGYTISNLKINTESSYLGLFGNVSGNISNFTIDNADVYVYDAYQYIGIACGYTTKDIKSVRVDGYIDAENSNYVGGVVGYTTAQLFDLSSDTHIVASDCVGGIAGYIHCATAVYKNVINYGDVIGEALTGGIAGNILASGTLYMELIENYGDVTGTAHTGGLFGYVSGNTSSLIKNCTSSSMVSGEYYVGAIAGESVNVKISECSNKGSSVSASSCVIDGTNYYAYLGGYVGKGYIVEKCTNDSDINYISCGSYVGGIAGYLTHSVNECSNNGNIKGYDRVGGLAGYISSGTSVTLSTLTNSGAVSGNSYVGGIVGLWNYSNTFVVSGCDNSGSISGIDNVGGIAGCLAKTSDKLLTVSGVSNSGDITATEGWVGGLFGYVDGNSSSTVQNCTSSANITGSYYVGGLIGQAVSLTLKDSTNEGSTVTATGFIVEGTENNVYLGGYVGKGVSISGCTNNSSIVYNSLGRFVGGVIGYATGNIYNCTNNGDIFSLGNCVGGIAGWVLNSVPASNTNYARNLVNNGEIKGVDNVGGIFGAFLHELEYGSCGGYRFTITVSAFQNNATVIGNNQVGGIVGNLYFNNSQDYYCKNHYSWGHHDTYSYCQLAATDMVNIGAVNGMTYVGEIFGNFWSDGNSTLTTYTILGSIIVNRETLEGEYSVGSSTNLTLSSKVLPETEGDTDTGDGETE